MSENILFVDDDDNILQAYERVLHREFTFELAQSGQAGLEAIQSRGPFAVVVSDFRMPKMDGIQFLASVRECAPEAVRVMLTGQADLNTAIAAVNEGNLFRFLTKPCSPDKLSKAIRAALEQYRLITAERDLLKKTLLGSIHVLTETLSLVSPTAFSRASRIRGYVKQIVTQLRLSNGWQFELAAMLSQVGCVTLPQVLLDKVYAGHPLTSDEQVLFAAHPQVACDLLVKIPRLESVAHMIAGQLTPPPKDREWGDDLRQADPVTVGACLLQAALDFDQLLACGASPQAALTAMRNRNGQYHPSLLDALGYIELAKAA